MAPEPLIDRAFSNGAASVANVAAPAVLNAIFAATGQRIPDLPVKNHNLHSI